MIHIVVGSNFALVGVNVNGISRVEFGDIHFQGKGAGVFHGVVKDGCNFLSNADAAGLHVGHKGNFFAHEVKDRVGGGFAGGSRAHHVSHIGQGESSGGLERRHLLQGSNDALLDGLNALPGILEHGQGMQGHIVRVGLARDLVDRDGNLVGDLGFAEKPLGIGPGGDDRGGCMTALIVQFHHIVKGIKDQQSVLQLGGSERGDFLVGILQERYQGVHVVSALHGAQELNGLGAGDVGAFFCLQGQGRQVGGLDVGRLVHSRRHAMTQQFY
eukprot:scaffold23056_cov51-Attheya_sp.AAC.2